MTGTFSLVSRAAKRRRWLAGFLTFAALTACSPHSGTETNEPEVTIAQTIYLVRHAEKQKGDNPGLTEAGHDRAAALRDRLAGQAVDHIHSSNYRRTIETADPVSMDREISIRLYDARDLPALAEVIKAEPGTHVVVGHSNTTPELAAILCGCETQPMPETEYDRIYEIRLGEDGADIKTIVDTYGDPS